LFQSIKNPGIKIPNKTFETEFIIRGSTKSVDR
jgi:hypothetical protein